LFSASAIAVAALTWNLRAAPLVPGGFKNENVAAPLAPALSVTSTVKPYAGNPQIAYDLLHGNTHLMVVGDSEQGALVGNYPSQWHIDRWSGYLGGPNYTAGFTGDTGIFTFEFPSNPVIGSAGAYSADTPAPDGVNGVSPAALYHITFNGQTAPNNPGFPPSLFNRVYQVANSPSQHTNFSGGPWLDTSVGKIHMDVLTYANPNGVAPGNIVADAIISDPNNPVATAPISTLSATGGWQKTTLTYDATPWPEGTGLNVNFRVLPGATPAAGSNLVIAGVRYYTDNTGFQMVNLAQGGRKIGYFTDPANVSEASLRDFINLTDTNTLYVWIGQNGAGDVTADQFMTQMQTLIARYKAAKPDMRFILVSTYDTGSPNLAGYADDLYQIAQSDPSVFFMNVYDTAGGFPYLDANYLSDHVHETPDGGVYFAELTNSILQAAAAEVGPPAPAASIPEPAAAIVPIAVIAVLSRGSAQGRAYPRCNRRPQCAHLADARHKLRSCVLLRTFSRRWIFRTWQWTV
jgi:hypothetical protein